MLKFGFGNMKMKKLSAFLGMRVKDIATFDLPAGWTCPKADICKTFTDRDNGKMKKMGRFTCYASKAEGYSPFARRLRWHNFDEIQSCGKDIDAIATLIHNSLPVGVKIVRIHASGDFYSPEYFQAWVKVASMNKGVSFFGYTKVLAYALYNMPRNMKIQYSYGSKDDALFDKLKVKPSACFVGEYEGQYNHPVVCGTAEKSHEDYFAIMENKTFVIGLH